MKFRTLSIYLAAILVTVALLFGVRAVQHNLDAQVAKHHLRYAKSVSNAPPLMVFTTVALGSFRGIIADMLWLRAQSLQNKHQYYEMVQLAQWITDLQPGFSGATCYLAWNMAYNISVTCSSPVERWYWVDEGIKLLRDKALEYNPDDPVIYKELSWIYAHKLGNVMDDANIYYKNRLAVEMQQVFGQEPDWERMANAPVGREQFLREYPAESPLWRDIPGSGLEEKYDNLYGAFKRSAPERPADLKNVDAKVLNYLRAELLRERYKLDSRKILDINKEYGTLDWRTPEAQAIYWARESIEVALKNGRERDINTDRIINNALYQSFLAGRVVKTDPDLEKWRGIEFITQPNLSLVGAVYKVYTDSQTYHDGTGEKTSSFRTARINFLKEAIYVLTSFGALKEAEKYYKILSDDEPQERHLPDGQVVKYGKNDFEAFVKAEWIETMKSANAKQAMTFLQGLIYCCIVNEIRDNHDVALFYEQNARYVYDFYAKTIGGTKRMEIVPYKVIKNQVRDWCLEVLPPTEKRRLEAIIQREKAEQQEEQRQTPPPPPGGK